MNKNEKSKTITQNIISNKIAKIFKIIKEQDQVLRDASWKMKKQMEEIKEKNKAIMQKHTDMQHDVKDLIQDVWDYVDPMEKN